MKKYPIKAGEYSSGWRFWPLFFFKEFSVDVMFDESCVYSRQGYDQINKLAGFCPVTLESLRWVWKQTFQGGLKNWRNWAKNFKPPHHYESFRMGWDPLPGAAPYLQIWWYEYKKGVRLEPQVFTTLKVRKVLEVRLPFTRRIIFGYRLYPHFGGQRPAPHDMAIFVRFYGWWKSSWFSNLWKK